MEITIAKKGKLQGTIGWLAEGLGKNDLSFKEGNLKSNNNHGLWLKGPNKLSQFLGAFNQYNLGNESGDYAKYDLACEYEDRDGIWSDAAWRVLMEIALAWCDEMNQIIENEEPMEIKIIRTNLALED